MHRLDPRAKVLTTLSFIIFVVSFGRYELTALIPFTIFPAVVIGLGDLPFRYLARKALLVCPFALAVGILNPLFDRAIIMQIGPLELSGGWVSCASIVLRSLLTVTAATTLIAVTGFPVICHALQRLGMPRIFAAQLLFLYRYLLVLAEEAGRACRARELRSFGKKGYGLIPFASMVGHLLLRTWQRAERIHLAMLARGSVGAPHGREEWRFGSREWLFLLGWGAVFVTLRLHNTAQWLGTVATGLLP